MIEVIVSDVVALAVGIGLGPIILRKVAGIKLPKHRCPWEPCGYPLPNSPLFLSTENGRDYATFKEEPCAGCEKKIIWDRVNRRYVRYAGNARGY